MIVSQTTNRNWVKGINSLRFILALIVLLSHFENPLVIEFKSSSAFFVKSIGSIIGVFFNGVAAVIAFFIISGFVIHQSSKDLKLTWRTFILKRYLRILLPLLVIILLGYKFNHPEKDILWSLICELIYYTVYPVLRKLNTNWATLSKFSFALSILIITIFAWHDVLAIITQESLNFQGHYWQIGVSLTWVIGLPCWILGILISENFKSLMFMSTKKIMTYRLLVFVISVVLNFMHFHLHLGYIVSMNFFALILYKWIQAEISYFKTHPPSHILENLGNFSYSIYIIHPLCYAVLMQKLSMSFFNYLIVISITLLLSYIFYLTIERPSHLIARKLHIG